MHLSFFPCLLNAKPISSPNYIWWVQIMRLLITQSSVTSSLLAPNSSVAPHFQAPSTYVPPWLWATQFHTHLQQAKLQFCIDSSLSFCKAAGWQRFRVVWQQASLKVKRYSMAGKITFRPQCLPRTSVYQGNKPTDSLQCIPFIYYQSSMFRPELGLFSNSWRILRPNDSWVNSYCSGCQRLWWNLVTEPHVCFNADMVSCW